MVNLIYKSFLTIIIFINIFGFTFAVDKSLIRHSFSKEVSLNLKTINDVFYLQECTTKNPSKVIINIMGDFSPDEGIMGLGKYQISGDCHVYTIYERKLQELYAVRDMNNLINTITRKYRDIDGRIVETHLVGHSRGAKAILDLYSYRTQSGKLFWSARTNVKNKHLALSPYLTKHPNMFHNLKYSSANIELLVGSYDNEDCLQAKNVFVSNNFKVKVIPKETHFGMVVHANNYQQYLEEIGLDLQSGSL